MAWSIDRLRYFLVASRAAQEPVQIDSVNAAVLRCRDPRRERDARFPGHRFEQFRLKWAWGRKIGMGRYIARYADEAFAARVNSMSAFASHFLTRCGYPRLGRAAGALAGCLI